MTTLIECARAGDWRGVRVKTWRAIAGHPRLVYVVRDRGQRVVSRPFHRAWVADLLRRRRGQGAFVEVRLRGEA